MNDRENKEPGTLELGQIHPATYIALQYIKEFLMKNNAILMLESLQSTALSGNEHCEIAGETLRRFLAKEPVSDRYLMGLAWLFWSMENESDEEVQKDKLN